MEEEKEDSIERVFRDISNASDNLTTLKYKCSPDLQKGNTEKQMCEQRGRLKRCSLKYAGLEAKYLFLEGLKDENWTNRTAEPEENYRHDLREKYNQVNEEVEDLEIDFDRLADTLLKKHGELREKLNVIEAKLVASKAKKQELEIQEEKSREMANKLHGLKSSTAGVSKEMQLKQSEAGFAIKQCNAAINSLEHCKTLLQSELSRQQEQVDGLKKEVEKQEMTKKQNNTETQEAAKWFTRTIELFRTLSGIAVKRFHEYSVVLEIRNETQHDAAAPRQSDMVVLLTIQFKPDPSKPDLIGAQIDVESFQIDDLVSEACRTNDVVALVQGVKMRVRSYLAALTEIEQLQTTYATDWEPTMGHVRVMLGKSGKVVCTLKVNPLNPCHVTLLRVEDTRAKREIPVADFQFTDSPPSSLSKWIERLHEQLK